MFESLTGAHSSTPTPPPISCLSHSHPGVHQALHPFSIPRSQMSSQGARGGPSLLTWPHICHASWSGGDGRQGSTISTDAAGQQITSSAESNTPQAGQYQSCFSGRAALFEEDLASAAPSDQTAARLRVVDMLLRGTSDLGRALGQKTASMVQVSLAVTIYPSPISSGAWRRLWPLS